MRADAVRRREALIAAAREMLLVHGADVALEAIADHAGVGIATLYRNFPSRESLVDATASAVLNDMLLVATEAVEAFPSDPVYAWRTFIDHLVTLRLGAVIPALAHATGRALRPQVAEAQDATERAVSAVLDEARAAGLLRPDLDTVEFVLAIARASQPPASHAPEAYPTFAARFIAMLVAGMKPDGHPLP